MKYASSICNSESRLNIAMVRYYSSQAGIRGPLGVREKVSENP